MKPVQNRNTTTSRSTLAVLVVLGFLLLPGLGFTLQESKPARAEPPLPELSIQRNEILNSVFVPLERPSSENGSSWNRSYSQTRNSVLAEVFSATWCPPCVRADEALEELLDEDEYYTRTRFNTLFYHPKPDDEDPFGISEGSARMRDLYGFDSFPSAQFNGFKEQIGSPEDVFDIYLDIIQDQLTRKQTLGFEGTVEVDGSDVSLNIEVLPLSQYTPISLRLVVVMVEDHIYFEGSNGITDHRYVVRDIISEEEFDLKENPVVFQKEISLSDQWNMSNSSVVVFAQSMDYQFFGGNSPTTSDEGDDGELPMILLALPVVALVVLIGAVAVRGHMMDKHFQEKVDHEKEQLHQTHHYKCESCSKDFPSREELKSHEKEAHYTSCPACGAKLKEQNLESHMKKAHGK